MPHSVPVSEVMIPPKEWPQLRGDADVNTAIKILRIISEEQKLEHGHSTPLVMDENFRLLGFVHLVDLLKSVRQVWTDTEESARLDRPVPILRDLVTQFAGSVEPEDSILTALDIMMDHGVSMVPVLADGKLKGIIKLSDIFGVVSGLLFDESDPDERRKLLRDYHC